MTSGFAWALTIVLSMEARAHPVPSWHATRERCEAQAALEVAHLEMTGRPVAWAGCQRIRIPQTTRGEVVR